MAVASVAAGFIGRDAVAAGRLAAVLPGWRVVGRAAGFAVQSVAFAASVWVLLAVPGVLG